MTLISPRSQLFYWIYCGKSSVIVGIGVKRTWPERYYRNHLKPQLRLTQQIRLVLLLKS